MMLQLEERSNDKEAFYVTFVVWFLYPIVIEVSFSSTDLNILNHFLEMTVVISYFCVQRRRLLFSKQRIITTIL